jgi:hypothetical protein
MLKTLKFAIELWKTAYLGSKFLLLWMVLRPILGVFPIIVLVQTFTKDGYGLLVVFVFILSNAFSFLFRNIHRIDKILTQNSEISNLVDSSFPFKFSVFSVRIFLEFVLPFTFIFLIADVQSLQDAVVWILSILTSLIYIFITCICFFRLISYGYSKWKDFKHAMRYVGVFFSASTLLLLHSAETYPMVKYVFSLNPVALISTLPLLNYGEVQIIDCVFIWIIALLTSTFVWFFTRNLENHSRDPGMDSDEDLV